MDIPLETSIQETYGGYYVLQEHSQYVRASLYVYPSEQDALNALEQEIVNFSAWEESWICI